MISVAQVESHTLEQCVGDMEVAPALGEPVPLGTRGDGPVGVGVVAGDGHHRGRDRPAAGWRGHHAVRRLQTVDGIGWGLLAGGVGCLGNRGAESHPDGRGRSDLRRLRLGRLDGEWAAQGDGRGLGAGDNRGCGSS